LGNELEGATMATSLHQFRVASITIPQSHSNFRINMSARNELDIPGQKTPETSMQYKRQTMPLFQKQKGYSDRLVWQASEFTKQNGDLALIPAICCHR
jgi:hypothetical protein